MKFIHTADLHIGASRKLDGYLARQEQMLHEIYRVAEEEKAGIVLLLGDIFHRKDIRPEERNMFLQTLLEYDKTFTTLIMSGNHDMLGSELTSLHFLKILEEDGRLKNTIIAEYKPRIVEMDEVTFVLVPWKGYNTNEFASLVDSLVKELPDHKPIIVCGHECVRNCTTDVGWEADGERYMRIVEHPRVKFYCFCDIHKVQKLGTKSWYSGSPIQHDFGDKPGKGVLVFDTSNAGPTLKKLEGIKPLITLNGMPEGKPLPDAYIRLKGSKVDKLAEVPDSVLYVMPEQEAVAVKLDDDLLEGIGVLLARRGLSTENQKKAIELAQQIVRSVGALDG